MVFNIYFLSQNQFYNIIYHVICRFLKNISIFLGKGIEFKLMFLPTFHLHAKECIPILVCTDISSKTHFSLNKNVICPFT